MLYVVLKPFRDREIQKNLVVGDLVSMTQERAEVALAHGYVRPAEPCEGLKYLIKEYRSCPKEWLWDGYHYAFEYEPNPHLPKHLKELIERLKQDTKIALERGFYAWARDRLELAFYLTKEDKVGLNLPSLAVKDLIGGEGELWAVIKAFQAGSRVFEEGDMVLPKKEIAFPLVAEGYIRPAYPGEALRYLATHRNYPPLWLGIGAWYAFMYPLYPYKPKPITEKVKKLFKEFEIAYEQGTFNECRKILEQTRYLVWFDDQDLGRYLNGEAIRHGAKVTLQKL